MTRLVRAHSLSESYLVIFLLSTVCHFHNDGIRRRRIVGSKDDSWQMAASAVIHQIWINQRPGHVVFLSFSSLDSLSLSFFFFFFFSLRFPSFYNSSFTPFFAKLFTIGIACTSTANGISVVRIFRFYLARPRKLSHKSL